MKMYLPIGNGRWGREMEEKAGYKGVFKAGYLESGYGVRWLDTALKVAERQCRRCKIKSAVTRSEAGGTTATTAGSGNPAHSKIKSGVNPPHSEIKSAVEPAHSKKKSDNAAGAKLVTVHGE